jgi:predicted nucleic-acid-binding Zn-ribbon protein
METYNLSFRLFRGLSSADSAQCPRCENKKLTTNEHEILDADFADYAKNIATKRHEGFGELVNWLIGILTTNESAFAKELRRTGTNRHKFFRHGLTQVNTDFNIRNWITKPS